jgi:hypothetical protein
MKKKSLMSAALFVLKELPHLPRITFRSIALFSFISKSVKEEVAALIFKHQVIILPFTCIYIYVFFFFTFPFSLNRHYLVLVLVPFF